MTLRARLLLIAEKSARTMGQAFLDLARNLRTRRFLQDGAVTSCPMQEPFGEVVSLPPTERLHQNGGRRSPLEFPRRPSTPYHPGTVWPRFEGGDDAA